MKRYLPHIKTSVVLLLVVSALALGFLFSGLYNIGANDPHYPLVYRALQTLRDRSITVRAADIEVPDLTDPAVIRQGAGNYHAMCTGCHLMPGMADSEMHRGLYPQPPDLTRERVDPRRAFWVIKNGIKASGMPSWGKSMEDQYLWGLVAFQQKLPELTPAAYQQLVAKSGGHSHGGGETGAAGGHDDGDEHGDASEPAGHTHGGEESAGHSHDGTEAPGHGHGAGEEPEPAESEEAGHSHGDAAMPDMPMPAAPAVASDGHAHSHAAATSTSAASAPAQPAAVVAQFEQALVAGNLAAAEALLDPEVQIFEGGNIERSREEYAQGHMKHDAAFLKSATIKPLSQAGDAVGDLAWVGSERRLSAAHDGKPVDVVSTETMVLKRAAAGWRITHIHWSSRSTAAAH